MTPEELIAWHAHQIALLPETDNVMVQRHREAMHCVERLRAELADARELLREAVPHIKGKVWFNRELERRIDAALKEGR